MAFGFPARFADSRTYALQEDELAATVKSALGNLGWPYKTLSGKELQAQVPHGPWSWGEEMRVEVLPGGRLKATSKSSGYAPALIDFGKNRKNIETFFAMVERCIGQGVYLEPVSAPAQQSLAQKKQVSPATRLAGSVLGGCLLVTIVLATLTYFIAAVIGLLSGYLYLPGRGHGGSVLHGALARIISAIILLVFAWIIVWVGRQRRKRR
jgi:hypothetical protein